jgi:hypothetical protein
MLLANISSSSAVKGPASFGRMRRSPAVFGDPPPSMRKWIWIVDEPLSAW